MGAFTGVSQAYRWLYHTTDRENSGSTSSGGAPSQLTATFMSELLKSGDLQRHIFTTLQPSYVRRYRSMIAAIEQYLLPLGVRLPQSDRKVIGGYFIWLTLPAPLDADNVEMMTKSDDNLIIAPGSLFAVYGDEAAVDLSRQVRLSFAWEAEEKLAEGIRRLSRVIASLQTTESFK